MNNQNHLLKSAFPFQKVFLNGFFTTSMTDESKQFRKCSSVIELAANRCGKKCLLHSIHLTLISLLVFLMLYLCAASPSVHCRTVLMSLWWLVCLWGSVVSSSQNLNMLLVSCWRDLHLAAYLTRTSPALQCETCLVKTVRGTLVNVWISTLWIANVRAHWCQNTHRGGECCDSRPRTFELIYK